MQYKKYYSWLCLGFVFLNYCFAIPSIQEIKQKMVNQRAVIQDYQADVLNYVEGSFIQNKNMEKGHLYFKRPGFIRSDILSPVKHSTLTTSNTTYTVDSLGNVLLLDKEAGSLDKQFGDPVKVFESFDFSVSEISADTLKLVGKPSSQNNSGVFSGKYFSKIVIYLDSKEYFAKEIHIYNAKDQQIAKIITKYQLFNKINFPIETITYLNVGKTTLNIKNSYFNVQINQGLSASVFTIEAVKNELLQKDEAGHD